MATTLEFLLDLKVIVVIVTLIGLFIAERLFPKAALIQALETRKARIIRWCKNLSLFGINTLLAPFITIPLTAIAHENAWLWRAEYTNGWWWVWIDLLILDCAIYWWHRINHEIPFLWRFHQVHHLDEFLDTTSAVRFHFGEVFLSALFRMLIIMAFGIEVTSVVIFEILLLVATVFHHSNLAIAKKLENNIGMIVITPAIHWIHHHAKRSDTDSNYGVVLSVWDQIFRSRSKTQHFDNMPIGVEGFREKKFLGLLLAPFKKISKKPN